MVARHLLLPGVVGLLPAVRVCLGVLGRVCRVVGRVGVGWGVTVAMVVGVGVLRVVGSGHHLVIPGGRGCSVSSQCSHS